MITLWRQGTMFLLWNKMRSYRQGMLATTLGTLFSRDSVPLPGFRRRKISVACVVVECINHACQ